MRITKEKAEENRAALVQAAGRLFRSRGIDGVGVAEISKEAGLTHGALYAHFPSKEALAAEALSHGVERGAMRLNKHIKDGAPDLAAFLDYYLAPETRDDMVNGCALAASASEMGRQEKTLSAHFAEGFLRMATAFEQQIARTRPEADARKTGLAIAAALIGGVAAARGTAKADPELSNDVLEAVRSIVNELGGLP
jgi:TetR/AcrR family transcriptional repressor of nem operon